jgi:Chaperone of endosialidase
LYILIINIFIVMPSNIIITPASGLIAFTSSSGNTQNITQNSNGTITFSGATTGVGIGTASPVGALHIVSNNQNLASDAASSYTNAKFRLDPFNTSSIGVSMGLISPNINYIQASYNNGTTAALSINPYGGNVGIGTISPASNRKLTVAGGAQFTFGDNSGASLNIVPAENGQDGADLNLSYYTGSAYGPLTFTLGNQERMRITSGGNVGIGTTTDAGYKLDVNGTGRFSGILGVGVAPANWANYNGVIELGYAGNNIHVTGTNDINIGSNIYYNGVYKYATTGRVNLLEMYNGEYYFNNAASGTAGGAVTLTRLLTIANTGAADMSAASVTTLTLRNNLLNGGSSSGITGLMMGDAGSSINILERVKQTVNTARTYIYSEQGYNVQAVGAFFYNTIAYQGNNSTAWGTTSDIRIKQNIRPLNSALEKIIALTPVHFEYKNKPNKIKTGFIAQEFETVLPGHVHEITPGDEYKDYVEKGEMIKAIDPDLVPYLVKAIQEQQTQIQALLARIETLENK